MEPKDIIKITALVNIKKTIAQVVSELQKTIHGKELPIQ